MSLTLEKVQDSRCGCCTLTENIFCLQPLGIVICRSERTTEENAATGDIRIPFGVLHLIDKIILKWTQKEAQDFIFISI